MPTRVTDAAQNAAVDGVVDLVDVGAGTAVLEIRSGAQPADADDVDAGTLLVSIDLADPSFGNAGASVVGEADLLGVPLSNTAVAAGTAGHFRIKDKDGNAVIDGDVTGTGGGGDIELDNTSIESGQTVNVTGYSLSIPASE